MNKKVTKVDLGGKTVSDQHPTFVIAEIGQNHNGDMNMAKKLVDMAARCGADAVKFTKRNISDELTTDAYNKIYDNPNSFGKTYGEHREFLEFDEYQHEELMNYSSDKGIMYFCTPCDIVSLNMLEKLKVPFFKVASRDLTNIPLLEEMGHLNKPVIISTGMASNKDIEHALEALNLKNDKIIIMHCTSQYPCDLKNVNLKAINTLKNNFGFLTGYSDHTSGIIVSVAATLMGACIIEKHITLNRSLKGTDQAGSLEEKGLQKLIDYILAAKISLGSEKKELLEVSLIAKSKLGRSITSKVAIKKGEKLTLDMICLKSPGDGLLWREKESILFKIAKKDIAAGKTLKINEFK